MKENRGLTLIELMITIGILSIVVVIAGSFMLTSGNSFAKGNADSNIQSEAQLAVNQIEDLVIDGIGVEMTDDADQRELILYHTEEEGGATQFIKEAVVWKKDGNNNMYYSKWNVVKDSTTGDYVEDGAAIYQEQLLAESVADFQVDLETIMEKTEDGTDIEVVKSVQIAVSCESGVGVTNAEYATSPLITLRNRMIQGDPKLVFDNVPISTETLVLYIADAGQGADSANPIIDRVTEVERSQSYNIFAMLDAITNVNDLVNWQIEEGNAPSKIDAGGRLNVSENEPNSYLTIVARYKSDPSKVARGVVKVTGGSLKSLDAVRIQTKSLTPFNPKYGSEVMTTGFSDDERAALHYKWTLSDPDRVESFTDNTADLELNVRQSAENYGKYFTITLVVSSDVTGQKVSDTVTYRIDEEGTGDGDSNMRRGRGSNEDNNVHYSFSPPPIYTEDFTYDYYFCDEYGNYISSLDYLKSCIQLSTVEGTGRYVLSFLSDLPADREFFVKVTVSYRYSQDEAYMLYYQRIHYISALQLYGKTYTYDDAVFLSASNLSFSYDVYGYEANTFWEGSGNFPVEYTIEEFDYDAPQELILTPVVISTVPKTDNQIDGQIRLDWECSDWSKVNTNNITLRKLVVKVTFKDYPDIHTYITYNFN